MQYNKGPDKFVYPHRGKWQVKVYRPVTPGGYRKPRLINVGIYADLETAQAKARLADQLYNH